MPYMVKINPMKTLSIILLVFVLFSCGGNEPKQVASSKKPQAKITTPVSNNYLTYQPSDLKLPDILLVAIDAHGDAQLALNHFHYAANQYGFRIIALKNVQNNDPKFDAHIQTAIAQATNEFALQQPKIIMAGFSGGARMALLYAQKHPAAGVIMLGAGPGKQAVTFHFPLAMISGTRDFNFVEQYYPINSPQVDNPELITLHWRGKHAWPDSTSILNALTFVLYRDGQIEERDINRRAQLAAAKKYKQEKNIFFYFKQLELISKTSVGDLQDKATQSIRDIRTSKQANAYFARFNETLKAEQKRNQYYMQFLDEKPLDWWQTEIGKLDRLIETEKGVDADSYARNRAFLGILLYSKTNAAIAGRGNAKLLPKYLAVYEMLEPENPDVFYFKARYDYILGDTEAAIKDLKKALKLGYKDEEKLHQAFPQMIISQAKTD